MVCLPGVGRELFTHLASVCYAHGLAAKQNEPEEKEKTAESNRHEGGINQDRAATLEAHANHEINLSPTSPVSHWLRRATCHPFALESLPDRSRYPTTDGGGRGDLRDDKQCCSYLIIH